MIIAYCERCAGLWKVPDAKVDDPKMYDGVCLECQNESDVAERPLTFGVLLGDVEMQELPEGWVAE